MAQESNFELIAADSKQVNLVYLQQAFSAFKSRDFKKAEEYYRFLSERLKTAPNIRAALAESLIFQEKYKEAFNLLKKSVNELPHSSRLHDHYAVLLAEIGNKDLAIKHFRRAIELDPGNTVAYYQMAFIDPKLLSLKDVENIESLSENPSIEGKHDRRIQFTLGKYYEYKKEYEKSFSHYKKGNYSKKLELNFQSESWSRFIHDIIKKTPIEVIHSIPYGSAPYRNIIIIGMPRSGTTLVEQILDSHPAVCGIGESTLLSKVAMSSKEWSNSTIGYPDYLRNLSFECTDSIGKHYIELLEQKSPRTRIFAEKLPANYAILPFILAILPRSKIIYCKRDPIDTCFSCYANLFTSGQDFSYDLGHLATYYKDFHIMMEHWKHVLPVPIYEVQYEKLVSSINREVHNLLSFCDLPFHYNCLRFHKNKRPIHTASSAQVRKPIYSSSISRAENYKEFLGELECLKNL